MGIKTVKSGVVLIASSLILVAAPSAALAFNNNNDYGNDNEHNKITICHQTGHDSYVQITPNANGNVDGHAGHGGDIIPAFNYNDHGTVKHFPGLNWVSADIAIYNNGCKVIEGNHGGTDCDHAHPCTNPGCTETGHAADDCVNPHQSDCDGDQDHSPASDCETGGLGGGPTTTPTTGQVLSATTSGGSGAAQVTVVPQGSVNGGEGAASRVTNRASMVGLVGALLSVGSGLIVLNRKQN